MTAVEHLIAAWKLLAPPAYAQFAAEYVAEMERTGLPPRALAFGLVDRLHEGLGWRRWPNVPPLEAP